MRFITASLAVSVSLILLITGSAIAEDEERGSNDSLKGKFRLSVNKTCTEPRQGLRFTSTSAGLQSTMATVTLR